MRRSLLQICAATLTFSIGLLVSGADDSFIPALILASLFFTIVKILASSNPDLHYVKVAILTLIIWLPFAKVVLNFAFPYSWSCEFNPPEVAETSGTTQAQKVVRFDQPVNDITDSDVPDCSCSGKNVNPLFYNSVWAGVIDGKTINKPTALYPQSLKSTNVRGVVAVSVLIDEAGHVVWAESLSGHPLLRRAAHNAACRARFSTSLIDGPPLRVSGILTYRFGL